MKNYNQAILDEIEKEIELKNNELELINKRYAKFGQFLSSEDPKKIIEIMAKLDELAKIKKLIKGTYEKNKTK